MEFKYALNFEYVLAAAFIPVIVNFALLVFNPERAQQIGKALVFQLAGFLILPLVIGGFMRFFPVGPANEALAILLAECAGALVMFGFAVPPVMKKEKCAAAVWLIGALSLVSWGLALYHMVLTKTA